MAENTADLCKDCSPTFTTFLRGMGDRSKEYMQLKANGLTNRRNGGLALAPDLEDGNWQPSAEQVSKTN